MLIEDEYVKRNIKKQVGKYVARYLLRISCLLKKMYLG